MGSIHLRMELMEGVITPGELVAAMAAITGMAQPSIVVIDRAMAEARLRKSGGRGRSAAKMDSRDAAVLLTAVMVSGLGNVAESVSRISNTELVPTPFDAWPMISAAWTPDGASHPIVDLPDDHTLLDLLTSLIEAARRGDLLSRFDAVAEQVAAHLRASPEYDEYKVELEKEISFFGAGLNVAFEGDARARVMLKAGPAIHHTYGEHKAAPPSYIRQSRSAGIETILLIGQALSGRAIDAIDIEDASRAFLPPSEVLAG